MADAPLTFTPEEIEREAAWWDARDRVDDSADLLDSMSCRQMADVLTFAASTLRRLSAVEATTRDLIEKLDRCALYGPADSAREAVEKTRALLLHPHPAQETR